MQSAIKLHQARLLEAHFAFAAGESGGSCSVLDVVWRDHLLASTGPQPSASDGGLAAPAASDASGDGPHGVAAYVPCPDVPASLVVDAALYPSPRATFRCLALGLRAGLSPAALQALLPAPLAELRLSEAIDAGEPLAVEALAAASTFGTDRACFSRREVVRALGRFSGSFGGPGKYTALRRALAVVDCLSRHQPSDTPPFAKAAAGLPTANKFVALLADLFVPIEAKCVHGTDLPIWAGVPGADRGAAFWSLHLAFGSSPGGPHVGLEPLGVAAACSLDYRSRVPAASLGLGELWRCGLCGDGRTLAAPAALNPKDGFSACYRCAAGWWATHGPLGTEERLSSAVGSAGGGGGGGGRAVAGLASFEAAVRLARYFLAPAGVLLLKPRELLASGWAAGEDGRHLTSPYLALALLAAAAASVGDAGSFHAQAIKPDGWLAGMALLFEPGGAIDKAVFALPFVAPLDPRSAGGEVAAAAAAVPPGWAVLPEARFVAHPALAAVEGIRASAAVEEAKRAAASAAATTDAAPPPGLAPPGFARASESSSSPVAGALPRQHPGLVEAASAPFVGANDPSAAAAAFLARPESLTAALEACNWAGVEACLDSGAHARDVSLPLALKLVVGCANQPRHPRARHDLGLPSGVAGGGGPEVPWQPAPLAQRLDPGQDTALIGRLLAAGARADAEDKGGELALQTALWLRRPDLVDLVRGAVPPPDPNATDLVGDTALHVVLYTDQRAMVEKVAALGHLDCGRTNLRGDTAITLVEKTPKLRKDYADIVALFNNKFKKHKKRQREKDKAAEAGKRSGADGGGGGGGGDGDGAGGSSFQASVAAAKPRVDEAALRLERIDALTSQFLLEPDSDADADAALAAALESRRRGGGGGGPGGGEDGEDEAVEVVPLTEAFLERNNAAATAAAGDDDGASFRSGGATSTGTNRISAVSSLSTATAATAAVSAGAAATSIDTFEDSAWEVELSDKVVRWFRKRSKRNAELCEMAVARLRRLAAGFWSFPTNQKILKGVPKGIHLCVGGLLVAASVAGFESYLQCTLLLSF